MPCTCLSSLSGVRMMESEGYMTTTDARGWINALIKAMHEETIGSWPDPEYKDEVYSALGMALQALSQEPKYYPPCEDCHKRMDEIRRIYDKLQGSNDEIIECPWCGTVIQHKVNNKGGVI